MLRRWCFYQENTHWALCQRIDAKNFLKSLRLTQLLRLGVPFSLSRQVFFPFE